MSNLRVVSVDINKLEHEAARAVQETDGFLNQITDLTATLNRIRNNAKSVLGEIDATRGRSQGMQSAARESDPFRVLNMLPPDVEARRGLARHAAVLLETFADVKSLDGLQEWLVKKRRGVKKTTAPRQIPGVYAMGSFFEPTNEDDPQENAGAYTLRIQPSTSEPATNHNLGSILLLALIGARTMGEYVKDQMDSLDDDDDPIGWDEG